MDRRSKSKMTLRQSMNQHTGQYSLLRAVAKSIITICIIALLVVTGFVGWNYLKLPEVATLRTVEFTEPLKIFTRDGLLITEIGEVKRTPVNFSETPNLLQKAFLAAEDSRFYEHSGIDPLSFTRAVVQYVSNAKRQTGASTITMQLARGFYLTNERTFWRKFREILLAIKIEFALPKEKIFELYLNKIFLGHKSYGVVAAASTYYNATINDLTLAQMASIAAIPKAPSKLNPISNPERNLERRNWILKRMLQLEYIDEVTANVSTNEPIDAKPHKTKAQVPAGYVAENVRLQLLEEGFLSKDGLTTEYLYNSGIHVYTTVDSALQLTANQSVFNGLMQYEERHGYKGSIEHFDLPEILQTSKGETVDSLKLKIPFFTDMLTQINDIYNYSQRLSTAIVIKVTNNALRLVTSSGELVVLEFENSFNFEGIFVELNKIERVEGFSGLVEFGDVVFIRKVKDKDIGEHWVLAQAPSAQTALVSLDPSDGAILAMVGGSDYELSQFNRASQAERLIGSNIKPLIYAYGFEHGLAPGSVFIDGPLANDEDWRPQNAGLNFLGPITLRRSLALSRNLVSIQLLNKLGVNSVANFIEQLGISTRPPRDLTLALGTASFSPVNAARTMTMFVNGGHLVEPHLIEKIVDTNNNLLYQRQEIGVCMRAYISDFIQDKLVSTLAASDIAGDTTTDPIGQLLYSEIMPYKRGRADLFNQAWADKYCSEDYPAPPKPISATTSYMLYNVMLDTIRFGTARRAKVLGRTDMAGKTGTTNDNIDAWFTGIHPMLVTSVWLGLDSPSSLGKSEGGSRAALPTWIDFMQEVKDRVPEVTLRRTPEVVSAYIDPANGERVESNFPNAKLELFTEESLPPFSTKLMLPQFTGSDGQKKVLARPEDIF